MLCRRAQNANKSARWALWRSIFFFHFLLHSLKTKWTRKIASSCNFFLSLTSNPYSGLFWALALLSIWIMIMTTKVVTFFFNVENDLFEMSTQKSAKQNTKTLTKKSDTLFFPARYRVIEITNNKKNNNEACSEHSENVVNSCLSIQVVSRVWAKISFLLKDFQWILCLHDSFAFPFPSIPNFHFRLSVCHGLTMKNSKKKRFGSLFSILSVDSMEKRWNNALFHAIPLKSRQIIVHSGHKSRLGGVNYSK